MNDNSELLKTLHRLRDQVNSAISIVQLGEMRFDPRLSRTRVGCDFVIGDFEIRDLRVSKVKCGKWCP